MALPRPCFSDAIYQPEQAGKNQRIFSTAAFSQVPVGTPYGNSGRNSQIGPGFIARRNSLSNRSPGLGGSHYSS